VAAAQYNTMEEKQRTYVTIKMHQLNNKNNFQNCGNNLSINPRQTANTDIKNFQICDIL
jgi:hypothetical protein